MEAQGFFEDVDYHFFCTGDINTERWIAINLINKQLFKNVFFIWVEPYLAGGHCLYLSGTKYLEWTHLFPDEIYKYNTIAKEFHKTKELTQREKGCNTTFTPYSGTDLNIFIGMLYPKILSILNNDSKNALYTWVGNLEFLEDTGIHLSQYAKKSSSYSLIERDIE